MAYSFQPYIFYKYYVQVGPRMEKIAIQLKGKSSMLSIKPLLHMSCFVLVLTASAGGRHSFFDSLFAQLGSPRCNAVTLLYSWRRV